MKNVMCIWSSLQDQSFNTQGYRPSDKIYPGLYGTSQLSCVPSVKGDELIMLPQGHTGIISLESLSFYGAERKAQ